MFTIGFSFWGKSGSYTLPLTLGQSTASAACGLSFPRSRFADTPTPGINTVIYTDAELTLPYNGQGLWYGIQGTNTSWLINTSGLIIDSYDCMV